MSSVTLLCGIIAQAGKVAAANYRDSEAYGDLVAAGLVQRNGLIQSMLCDACDTGHDATIVFKDGTYGFFCPGAGFVNAEKPDLVAVEPVYEVLAKQCAEALGCAPGAPVFLADRTLHIGTVKAETADIAVFFHPSLQSAPDMHALEAALRFQIRTQFRLVLTASGALAGPGLTTAPLNQVFRFDSARRRLVAQVDPSALVGAPVKPMGGRPSTYGKRIKAIIAKRAARGCANEGKNAEIRAVQADYAARFPGGPVPSRSTIMYHLRK